MLFGFSKPKKKTTTKKKVAKKPVKKVAKKAVKKKATRYKTKPVKFMSAATKKKRAQTRHKLRKKRGTVGSSSKGRGLAEDLLW